MDRSNKIITTLIIFLIIFIGLSVYLGYLYYPFYQNKKILQNERNLVNVYNGNVVSIDSNNVTIEYYDFDAKLTQSTFDLTENIKYKSFANVVTDIVLNDIRVGDVISVNLDDSQQIINIDKYENQ